MATIVCSAVDPPAGRADRVADLDGVRVLVDLGEPVGEREQVLVRVELGLAVEAHGGRDRVRQRRALDQHRRQPGLDRRLGLVLDVRALRRIGVRRAHAEVAVDAVALDARRRSRPARPRWPHRTREPRPRRETTAAASRSGRAGRRPSRSCGPSRRARSGWPRAGSTRAPASCSSSAAVTPTMPPPITATSAVTFASRRPRSGCGVWSQNEPFIAARAPPGASATPRCAASSTPAAAG